MGSLHAEQVVQHSFLSAFSQAVERDWNSHVLPTSRNGQHRTDEIPESLHDVSSHDFEVINHSRNLNSYCRIAAKPLLWVFFKSAKSGAQTTLYCAMEPTIAGDTGKYYSDCKLKEPEPHAKDDAMAEWLWNISEKLTGLNR